MREPGFGDRGPSGKGTKKGATNFEEIKTSGVFMGNGSAPETSYDHRHSSTISNNQSAGKYEGPILDAEKYKHRFGPNLTCLYCVVSYDEFKADPKECKKDKPIEFASKNSVISDRNREILIGLRNNISRHNLCREHGVQRWQISDMIKRHKIKSWNDASRNGML